MVQGLDRSRGTACTGVVAAYLLGNNRQDADENALYDQEQAVIVTTDN